MVFLVTDEVAETLAKAKSQAKKKAPVIKWELSAREKHLIKHGIQTLI